MDRNVLLASTRTEFLEAFRDAIVDLIPRCVESLFAKAERSHSSINQGRIFDARGVLAKQGVSLQPVLVNSLEQLLNRSFQTAYNTFRPAFSVGQQGQGLSLLDSSAFEDELRIDILTSRFRNEAEEQLRDLNIRIALLFEQDNIKERENPFRPYLFSRCFAVTVETLGLSPELAIILIEQLAEEWLSDVAELYGRVNAHLACHGVAAQLQLKIKKFPPQSRRPEASSEAVEAQSDAAPDCVNEMGGSTPSFVSRSQPMPAASQLGKLDQLMQTVRNRAYAAAGEPSGGYDSGGGQGGGYDSGGGQGGGYGSGGGQGGGSGSVAAPGTSAGSVKGGWLAGTHIVGETLRKFFSAGGGSGAQPASQGGGQGSDAAASPMQGRLVRSLRALVRQGTPASEDMLSVDGEVRNLIMEQRSSLNGMTSETSEQMIIDIVAMLFELILRDSQVPAEVRAQLGRLQFLVLKIAMLDPELLTRKTHPARMLVNRIGSISLGLKQIDPSGARVSAEICRIVEALLADETEDAQLFSKMLDEFDQFITRELLASDEQVESAVHVMETAGSRTLRFARTTARIEAALNGLIIDPFLHHFLVTAWAHAIERAERTDADGGLRFRCLIPQLLWSILPKVIEQDRKLLLSLLPVMLPVLREGMALADLVTEQQQVLLHWLADAHASAMRASKSASPSMSLSVVQEHFQQFVDQPDAESPLPPVQDNPELDNEFLDEAIRELEAQLNRIDPIYNLDADLLEEYGALAVSGELPSTEPDAAEADEAVLLNLRNGIAIEINLSGSPGRGMLSWVSPGAANLVLSIEGVATPSIISARMFRRLLANGRARFVEAAPLFERAVQSLLLSADQVDGVSRRSPAIAAQSLAIA